MSTDLHPVDETDEPVAEVNPRGAQALWFRDRGTLPHDARRALVALVKGPSLDECRHPDLWRALLSSRADIESRLADMFLDLVVDVDRHVAFVRNVTAEDANAPSVVRRMPLTFLDTVILLLLRRRLMQAHVSGNAVFVERSEILDEVAPYRAHARVDEARFFTRVDRTLDKLREASILRRTQTEERWEVSPILELVFSADEVAAVRAEYERLLSLEYVPSASDSDEIPDADEVTDGD